MAEGRVLLVEDEPGLQLTLSDRLAAEGYEVETAGDGELGLTRALTGAFDLVVLDVMLPKRDGFDVCRTLRQRGITTPILMLTARGQVVDRVVGLKLGADDYLVKPFEAMELLARIEALLRRAGHGAPPPAGTPGATRFEFDDVTVDTRKAEVVKGGVPVELSAKEFHLLRYFLEHRVGDDTHQTDVATAVDQTVTAGHESPRHGAGAFRIRGAKTGGRGAEHADTGHEPSG